jgi:hypothetical protein
VIAPPSRAAEPDTNDLDTMASAWGLSEDRIQKALARARMPVADVDAALAELTKK